LKCGHAHVFPLFERQFVRHDCASLFPDSDIDDGSPSAGGLYGLVESNLNSSTIVYDVNALTVTELPTAFHNVILQRIEDIVGAKVSCKFLSLAADFRYDNLVCSLCFQGKKDCDANGTASENQDAVAFLEGADFYGMPSDRKWFNER
jgi:hypothetical protein